LDWLVVQSSFPIEFDTNGVQGLSTFYWALSKVQDTLYVCGHIPIIRITHLSNTQAYKTKGGLGRSGKSNCGLFGGVFCLLPNRSVDKETFGGLITQNKKETAAGKGGGSLVVVMVPTLGSWLP